jgi:hypothetical protein
MAGLPLFHENNSYLAMLLCASTPLYLIWSARQKAFSSRRKAVESAVTNGGICRAKSTRILCNQRLFLPNAWSCFSHTMLEKDFQI